MSRRRPAALPEPDGGALCDQDFDEVFTAENIVGDGSPLLLAVSGGPDSTALMHAATTWSAARGAPPIAVATVDHGLRRESLREAEAVAEAARARGLPHAVLSWVDRPDIVSQEAAREARYRLLAGHACAIGAARIATAHTYDDQVETILIRLASGSGLSGLAGMAPVTRRGPLAHLRPFLHLRKAQLVATCRARGWSFAEDPTNRAPRFARPRWRALAAALAAEGLTAERLFRLGARLRRADVALEAMVDRGFAEALRSPSAGVPGQSHMADTPRVIESAAKQPSAEDTLPVVLDFTILCRQPDEIALRILIRALRLVGPNSDHLRLERVEAALGALLAARASGGALRRTLAGCVLSLDARGILTIRPEPARRRGR